jgi:L-aspartate semialdehyde sulfurtransferase ferredoxin
MLQKRRVVLTFPPDRIERPVIYRLVKDYDLVLNILRAQVNPEEGKMVLELEGPSDKIKEGLKYLRNQKISVDLLVKDIKLNTEECISCGACVAVCSSGALSLDIETAKLNFNRDKCILCGCCVVACPLSLIEVEM